MRKCPIESPHCLSFCYPAFQVLQRGDVCPQTVKLQVVFFGSRPQPGGYRDTPIWIVLDLRSQSWEVENVLEVVHLRHAPVSSNINREMGRPRGLFCPVPPLSQAPPEAPLGQCACGHVAVFLRRSGPDVVTDFFQPMHWWAALLLLSLPHVPCHPSAKVTPTRAGLYKSRLPPPQRVPAWLEPGTMAGDWVLTQQMGVLPRIGKEARTFPPRNLSPAFPMGGGSHSRSSILDHFSAYNS